MIACRAERPAWLRRDSWQNGLLINGEGLCLFMRGKKSLLPGVLGVALTSIWKGGFDEYPTRETVKPAEVSGWVDTRGDGGGPWPLSQSSGGGAAAGADA